MTPVSLSRPRSADLIEATVAVEPHSSKSASAIRLLPERQRAFEDRI